MITNKDISIDSENGKITLNGNKYDLGTQGEIDTAVKDVYSVMGQLGAKNLIPYPYYETTKTQNGVTFTDNGDGTIDVDTDGSASTGNAIFFCQIPNVLSNLIKLDKDKTYIISDTTHSSIANNYTLGIRYFAEGVVPSTSTGTAVSCNSSNNWQAEISNAVSAVVYIYVYSGKTINNITFKPMLRLASDTDNTYQPYAKTNKQLTEQIATKQDAITNLSYSTTGLTPNANCSIKAGGYIQVGKLVIVNIRVLVTATGAEISGLPIPAISDQNNGVGGVGYNTSDGSTGCFYINNANGSLMIANNVSSGDILISLVYAAN